MTRSLEIKNRSNHANEDYVVFIGGRRVDQLPPGGDLRPPHSEHDIIMLVPANGPGNPLQFVEHDQE